MDKKVLHVVDMSPCIYAGSFNRHSFIQERANMAS